MKAFRLTGLIIVLSMVLAACAPAATPAPAPTATPMPQPTMAPNTIVDVAVGAGSFTTLVAAVQAAGLVETLQGDGPFTVFAPSDEAFAKLPAGTLEDLLKPENKDKLTAILTYHVVSGAYNAEFLRPQKDLVTVQGTPLTISVSGSDLMVDGAKVVTADIQADNGIIHVIDSVLLPPQDIVDTAVTDGRFTTLAAALTAAGLVETLKGEGPFTVFAPTDDAFAKLPAGTIDELLKMENKQALTDILTYHVVSGNVKAVDAALLTEAATVLGQNLDITTDNGKLFINGAEVIIADIKTSNGVIHVIDTVLLPRKDIVDTAVADGRFTTLAAALGAAGLVETLKGEGPFTVFAPTDDAFATLPEGTVESLLLPENKQQLVDILTYHVVSGSVMAADVVKLNDAKTVNGAQVRIQVKDGMVYLNDAQVIITDIKTTNGVIHVIDSVILPPQDIVDTAVADGRFTTLAAALGAAGLVDTLKGEGPFTVFAPTDEAFAKLPAGTIDSLLLPENKQQLIDILTYHVVAGNVYAADVVTLTSADTVLGKPVTIKVEDGKVYINDAQVIITDIFTANGVIHVIDMVILPPQ